MSASLVKSFAALGMIRFPKAPGRKRPGFPARKPKHKPSYHTRFPQKLTDAQVREIRARWETHEKVEDIARDYGITPALVSGIGNRRKRRNVTEKA